MSVDVRRLLLSANSFIFFGFRASMLSATQPLRTFFFSISYMPNSRGEMRASSYRIRRHVSAWLVLVRLAEVALGFQHPLAVRGAG